MTSLGLYLDLPFCIARCAFCSFNIHGYRASWGERYLAALEREIDLHPPSDATVTSLYLGGGTPTIHPPAALARLIACCRRKWVVADDAEITLEAHPATVTAAAAEAWRAAGMNRLSIGVQSLSDTTLLRLGRHHTAAEAASAVAIARAVGFDSVGIDLLFALPDQTLTDWETTLDAACALSPDHISVYALSIDTGTLFHKQGVTPVADTDAADQYRLAQTRLAAAGYAQYEISNFARPGFACRHNLRYWDRADVLGLGLSAASYRNKGLGGVHWENTVDLTDYLARIARDQWPINAMEEIDEATAHKERIVFGLRKSAGIPSRWMTMNVDTREAMDRMVGCGWIEVAGEMARLTPDGMLFADTVALALM